MWLAKGETKQTEIRSALSKLFKKERCETDLGYTLFTVGHILRKEAKLDVSGTILIKCILEEFGHEAIDKERNKREKRDGKWKRTFLIRANPIKKNRMPHSNDRIYCLTHGL